MPYSKVEMLSFPKDLVVGWSYQNFVQVNLICMKDIPSFGIFHRIYPPGGVIVPLILIVCTENYD